MRAGKASLILRYPRFRFRPGQADALNVDLWVRGANLLRDAGSYSYNSKPDMSGYFSGTLAHNTVQFDDRDQMPKLSRFLFGGWLKTQHVTSISRNNSRVSCTAGYLDFRHAEHVRTVHLSKNYLSVVDRVKGFEKKAVLRWRLPDGCWEIQNSTYRVLVSDGDSLLAVTSDVPILTGRLTGGWVSMFYMHKESVSVLEVEINIAGQFTTEYRWSA